MSWEHIPDQHWGDTPGGYIIEVTPPRESVGHTDITRLKWVFIVKLFEYDTLGKFSGTYLWHRYIQEKTISTLKKRNVDATLELR